jgi:prepilin-type N-terminal cleavage/methylation domain-containing protein
MLIIKLKGEGFMRKDQGFSLIELLIVVAIIAIIAAIAVPSMLQARMAANESGAIQGCRTVGSAEVAYAAVNNQTYAAVADLVTDRFLDDRFGTAVGFNGYVYADDDAIVVPADVSVDLAAGGFGVMATPNAGSARYLYSIAPDQVVRYQGKLAAVTNEAKCGGDACAAGDAIGTQKAAP